MDIVLLVVVIVVVVVFVYVGIGTWFSYDAPKANGDELAADPCAQCELDRQWFESQDLLMQIALGGWWATNRLICALRGC